MPIDGCNQPDVLCVNEKIRLRKYDGKHTFALPWYQDVDTVYLVDGIREPYNMEKLGRMYRYLDDRGELYFIEWKENGRFLPIGDVTFWQYDMPIVIGNPMDRGKGIGKCVIERLIERGKDLGYATLYVKEIYRFNIASQRTFESAGFMRYLETDKGYSYRFDFCK